MSDKCSFPCCKQNALPGKDMCFSHNLKFGSKEVKEAKEIPIRTVKRLAEEKLYAKNKKEYLATHLKCEVKKCNHVAVDIHHKKGRIGKLLYDIKHFFAVCRAHHIEIENHPEMAKELGYSKSRLNK